MLLTGVRRTRSLGRAESARNRGPAFFSRLPSMTSPIRRWVQAILLSIGVIGLTQCVDATGPRSEFSTFGVTPVWDSRASHTLGVLDEGGFPLDRVRIILIKPVSDTVKDTTITMHRSDPGIDLPLTVRVVPGVTLEAVLQFKSGETLLYEGKAVVETVPLNRPNPRPFDLPMEYLGPGKDAALVLVTPSAGRFPTGANVVFTAAAFNPSNNAIPGIPIAWTVDDATLGAFTAPGVFTPTNKGGAVTVTATTPTGIAGSATVTLVPPSVATGLAIESGDGQTATVQTALVAPFVVKVTDQFGDPMNGVTVTWTQLSGGGTLAGNTSTTNASGLASMQYTLGGVVGDATVRASVTGIGSPVTFTVHAIAGAPAAIAVVSGSAQTDTVAKTLGSPFIVKVTDAAGNALGGVTVNWARLTGVGAVSAATSTTNAQGLASIQFTLGTSVGAATIRASVTGLAPTVTFTADAVAGKPASILVVSGDGQTETILHVLPNPFVVKVMDAYGNVVSGATVTWTRMAGYGSPAAGTSTTNASGVASYLYHLGDVAGTETVNASVSGVGSPATFTATTLDVPPENLGLPIVTGFAYLRVLPSPVSPRVGDTLTFTVDSVDAAGHSASVTALWASNNPGRGSVDANGRLIVADTGAIIITATRNGLIGHARVTILPAPRLTGFSFAPKTLTGISNNPLTATFTFAALDAGTGVTSATLTLTGPGGTTRTCTFGAPTTGTARNGVFDCALTLPAASPAGAWHVTSLVLNGSITRTYGESVLALFSPTTLTINP